MISALKTLCLSEMNAALICLQTAIHSRESLIDDKYSRVRLIYGANASGKTSFIRAVAFVRWFIFNSSQLLENVSIPVVPFKFRHDAKNIPSEFALTFVMQEKKYRYEFPARKRE